MLKEFVITIQSWGRAHRFIFQHKLTKWVLIPGLIYAALFMTGMYFFFQSVTSVIEYITQVLHLSDRLQQFRSSFLGFLFTVTGVIVYLTLLMFYFSFFKYICLILGSPLFAFLDRKTELAMAGHEETRPAWADVRKDAARGAGIALRNCGWQTVYLVALLLLSFIPVIGWITPLIVLLMECYYYGFSMLDYSFARNEYTRQQSIDYIGHHRGLAIGNGILFYLMHLILFAAPAYAIISATHTVHQVKQDA